MLQVTKKIRSYKLNSLPAPRGVTVTSERYTHGVPSLLRERGSQFVTGDRAMSLQLASASYIYIHYALKKKEKRAAVVAKAGRLEYSVGGWVI
jgi:hypothetical protein